jgi:hypothetical protein
MCSYCKTTITKTLALCGTCDFFLVPVFFCEVELISLKLVRSKQVLKLASAEGERN